ncbi:hypothetical protein IID22_01985 [Patescibacteria group bacterium]|nr:hypothetical protein [Patescibacteria group bacterium]
MTERNTPGLIKKHPDTGRELNAEESQAITDYNSDSRNFAASTRQGITKIPTPKELLAEPFDRRVTSSAELRELGLKDA